MKIKITDDRQIAGKIAGDNTVFDADVQLVNHAYVDARQSISQQNIESIERATLAAICPQIVEELAGWLLAFDDGTVGRAKCAVPLQHEWADPSLIEQIERRYLAHGLPAQFRLPEAIGVKAFQSDLARRGYTKYSQVLVQVGSVADMRAVSSGSPAQISNVPDEAWAAVFLGEGFDPIDGASRVRSLSRSSSAVFASMHAGGRTVAAGAGVYSHGWASVHGMRTEQASRGRGFAGNVLVALANAALEREVNRVFLQVDESNTGAQALYARAGFKTAWRYGYWRKA